MPRNPWLEVSDISLLLYSIFISLREPFLVENCVGEFYHNLRKASFTKPFIRVFK